MKKIKCVYIDIISSNEHKNYNNGLLRNLPSNISVDICAKKNYISKQVVPYENYISIPDRYIYKYEENRKFTPFYMRWKTSQTYYWINKNLDFGKYDIIIWAYTEIITFWITSKKWKQRVLFMDHLVGKIKDSQICRWFFKHIRKEYEFIAFENYIADFLKNEIKIKNKIYVVRHPLPEMNLEQVKLQKTDQYIFAPALSNDEKFIDFLIENERKIPKEIRIIIRSKKRSCELERLIVYQDRLSQEEYLTGILNCEMILIHYGDNYNFRTSGVLYEAVKCNKPVCMYCSNTLNNYQINYPQIIFPFYNNNEFLNGILGTLKKAKSINSEDFKNILKDYSDEIIKEEILKIMEERSEY